MSSDQRNITDYDSVDENSEDNNQGNEIDWTANVDEQTRHHCTNCGSHICADYARLHKDEDGDVHRCPRCATQREIFEGRATDPDRDVRDGKGGDRTLGSQL